MNNLRDELLREDGINPSEVSEREWAQFRTLLAEEEKRARRLGWFPVPRIVSLKMPRALRITSVACLLAILGGMAITSFFQSTTVYARALANLRQAQSIHAVGYGFQDGRPVRQSEIWHLHGVGTRIQWQRGQRRIEVYDDGQDTYEYAQGDDYAVKRNGQGQLLPRELIEPLRYVQDARRDRSRDMTIESNLHRCYRREDPNNLSLMWIDGAMRFKRYEEHRRIEGRWQQVELVEISYNEPFELDMPPGAFERQGIRIIEPAQVLETRYALENAVAREEVLGLIFAVHELYRYGDYLFLTSSVRPTEQSLLDLGAGLDAPVADHTSYGGFDLSSWWQRKADGSIESRPYAIAELGSLQHRGVEIHWHVLLPRGHWPGQRELLEVCAYVRTDDPLRGLRRQKGLDWHGQFRPLLTVKIPDRQSDWSDLARGLYKVGHLVTGISRAAQNVFVSPASGVAQEQFQQRLEHVLTGLRPMGEFWDQVGSDLKLQLLDERGAPVSGAWLASRVKHSNGTIHPEPIGADQGVLISDAQGQSIIPGSQFFHRDSSRDSRAIVYAFEPERRLVACPLIGDDFSRPLSVEMKPAGRIRISLAAPESKNGADTVIHADVRMSVRKDLSQNRILIEALRVSTQDHSIEIPLPPGEYLLSCYATHDGTTLSAERHFRLSEKTRDLDLGTIELAKRP